MMNDITSPQLEKKISNNMTVSTNIGLKQFIKANIIMVA